MRFHSHANKTLSYEWLWSNRDTLIRQIGNGLLRCDKELRHKIENSKYNNWRMYYSTHPRELAFSFLNYHVHNAWKWVVVCQSAQWSYIPEDNTKTRNSFKILLWEIKRYFISTQNIKGTDMQTSGDNKKRCKIKLKLFLKQDYCATWNIETLKLNL